VIWLNWPLNRHHSQAVRTITLLLASRGLANYSILYHFRDTARYWLKIVIFSYPIAFDSPVGGVPVGVLSYHLLQTS